MARFNSQKPYIRQIGIYFQKGQHKEAYKLAWEFVDQFPDEMISHFLLAKAAFWVDDFKKAKAEGVKAFNLAKGQDELAVTGILLACTHYRLKEYEQGMKLLRLMKTKLPVHESIAKLKFVFALALHDEPAAMKHLDTLYSISKKEASLVMLKLALMEEL